MNCQHQLSALGSNQIVWDGRMIFKDPVHCLNGVGDPGVDLPQALFWTGASLFSLVYCKLH